MNGGCALVVQRRRLPAFRYANLVLEWKDSRNVGLGLRTQPINARLDFNRPWRLVSGSSRAIDVGYTTRIALLQRGRALFAHVNEVPHQRIDFRIPAPSVEYAVMADAGLDVVALHVGPDARAQVLRRECLADSANVIPFTLDREQKGALDGARIDASTAIFKFTQRQVMFLEYAAHGLQIEVRRQIHDREIFLIESPDDLGLVDLLIDKVTVEIEK